MSKDANKPVARYKLVILGDAGVGKTTLTQRYMTGVFEQEYKMTIGVEFYVKKLEVEAKLIGLQIWDFAGEKEFRFLLRNIILGTQGAIFMYDITRFETYKNINEWLELYQKANEEKDQLVPGILVGAKLDLKAEREVTKEDGKNMAKKWELIDYIECSSKTGEKIDDVFQKISRIMMFLDGIIEEA